MQEEYKQLTPQEAIRVENEFIKMKLMLEHGASFEYDRKARELTAETERNFLQYIMDFEQKEALAKEVSVFEILGCPQHFPNESRVCDGEMGNVLQDILQFMNKKRIELIVFSPNVTERALYRFITEELFRHRLLYVDLPDTVTSFVYDEFHPDYAYENTRTAVAECLQEILQSTELRWTFQFEQYLSINQHRHLSTDTFRRRINAFKSRYRHIEPLNIESRNCTIEGHHCIVSGWHETCFTTEEEHLLKTGSWKVWFRYWEEVRMWMIYEIEIDGIDL